MSWGGEDQMLSLCKQSQGEGGGWQSQIAQCAWKRQMFPTVSLVEEGTGFLGLLALLSPAACIRAGLQYTATLPLWEHPAGTCISQSPSSIPSLRPLLAYMSVHHPGIIVMKYQHPSVSQCISRG